MTTQDLQQYPKESHHLQSGYYGQLRSSTDALHALGLQVIPSINEVVSRDEFSGLADFEDWKSSGCSDIDDPENFGLKGTQICGSWGPHKSTYWGHFPVRIRLDGTYILVSRHNLLSSTTEDVHRQIEIAEEYSIPIGISVNPMTIKNIIDTGGDAPNSIIYAGPNLLEILAKPRNIRIETDGDFTWSYAYVNFKSEDINEYFNRVSGKNFSLAENPSLYGGIERNRLQPAYPSNVLGKQLQLISSGKDNKIIFISSASSAGIQFDVEDEEEDVWLDDTDDLLEEEEEEEVTDEAIAVKNWAAKSNQAFGDLHSDQYGFSSDEQFVVSTSPIEKHDEVKWVTQKEEEEFPWLAKLFPSDLARACHLLVKNLPFSQVTVALGYMAGIASLLKLGTKINGNQLTRYEVPPNLFVAFIGRSGAKKTQLKRSMIDLIRQKTPQAALAG